MSDAYNQDFKGGVESFLCRYPLAIDGAPKSLRFVDLSGNRLDTSDFFQAGDLTQSEGLHFRQQVESLPRLSALDAHTRTALGANIAELKGRRDPQQQTATAKRSLWRDPWELGNEADFFFTASLTGCTVYVAGPLASPTVFHANGKSLRGMAADAASVARTQNYMNYVLAMIEEERGIVGDAQMLRSPGGTAAPAAARDDYRFTSTAYQDAKLAKHGTNVEGLSVKAYTTVAGSRNAASGAWAFWYQVWARVPYTKAGVRKDKVRILHVEQLWPSIAGHVSVQPADFLPPELK